MKKHFFVTVALLFALLPAAAIGPKLGLQARVGVNISDFNTNTDGLSLSSRMGFHGAVAVPLTFGAIGVQPELMYIRNTMKISGEKIKMSNVKFPVLFSLRLLPPLRLLVGPAFSLSDNSYYKILGERREFGSTQPTVTYMAGAALKLSHLVIDCRFHGAFNKTDNYFEGAYPRIKSYALMLGIGYAF
ncbi:outer membrane beta-barrel protein [uncultured Alistipes sp.]|uniref:outer membrane beta-barrel protein n=1 Tax=uncultured Alistipes sp. TaxID=538949 RepID=UPI0026058AED|nr:outer membrane beta-barrel protein [uncultured Alistipes sp.]